MAQAHEQADALFAAGAEQAGRASEIQSRAVLDVLPIGLAILDHQSQLVYSNRKYVELCRTPSDLAAWAEAIHPADRERVLNSRDRALARGESWADTYRFVPAHGTTVWVNARAVPLRVGSDLAGFVLTLEDVTATKIAEEKIHRAHQELQMHAGRLEQEVQQRMAKAEEALYELERLGYSIVHDMRAPLRTIQSYGQILLQEYSERLDDEASGMLRRMTEAAHRQDGLIRDVLSYHSYVREEFPLNPVSLDDLVQHILETYPHFQRPRAIIEVRHPLGWALAHETLLTQCASVLLDNAVKFVAHGVNPEIVVWTEQGPSAVKLWVQDNGIGIAPDYHAKIFNIFETLHPSAMFPGRGIGLPLAKKAVEKMQGAIGVESEVGKGARFWLALKPVPRD